MDMVEADEKQLLAEFVAAFEKLSDLSASRELDPVAWELSFGEVDEYGFKQWRPINSTTDRSHCDQLYIELPERFPPLYERLILSFRWAEVDLKSYRLLANPPGRNFDRLLAGIIGNKALSDELIPKGYIQFGKGADLNYDPVCFDLKHRLRNGDYRIVQVDHEEILCNRRIKEVAELAPSFRQLVLNTIEEAKGNTAAL